MGREERERKWGFRHRQRPRRHKERAARAEKIIKCKYLRDLHWKEARLEG